MGERIGMTTKLHPYGIQTEDSEIRAHVSVVNRTLYVYQTADGVRQLSRKQYKKKTVYQYGVDGPTGVGYPVPWNDIPNIRCLRWREWERWGEFNIDLPTPDKGRLAVDFTCDVIRAGYFPFWINATEDSRQDVQIAGTDIVVFCRKKIQVKCDYNAGHKPAGYGNLAERNPLGLH